MRSYYGGGNLEIHTIDVGQGASELIIGPDGTSILIDGGTGGKGSSKVVPYLNAIFPPDSRHLDYMIASHDDNDHYGGLNSVLSGGYTAGTIYHCGINSSFGRGVQIPLGLEIDLGGGARATCVGRYGRYIDGSSGRTDDNNASICLLIEYGVFDYLTAGDLEDNEIQLSNALISCPPGSPYLDPAYGVDVIHVNHHGSNDSSRAAYVNRLKHGLAVINGGEGHGYGHPRWTAVDRLKGRANYSDGSGPTGVTWTGCNSVYRTTYDIVEDGRAPEWDCPTLGDMVLVYDGCSLNYSLNGNSFRVDQQPVCFPTATPPDYHTPTPTSTPCNAWVRLTDVTDITLGWIEYTRRCALGICLVNSGPGEPDSPSQWYGWIYDAEDVYDDGREFYDHPRLWLWNQAGYPITIPEGYYFDVYHDSPDAASPLRIWLAQTTVPSGWEWHPSIGTDGTVYTDTSNCTVWKAPVTPTPTPTAMPMATATPTVTPSAAPSATPSAPKTPQPTATPSPPLTPPITPTPLPTPHSPLTIIDSGDYDGDGTSEVAIFRTKAGMWAVRGGTRVYYGGPSDLPVSGDYDGDGTSDIGIFRRSSGLWAVRNVTRAYYGASSDAPVPGDYDGDGSCDIGIFRPSSGLWAIRLVSRIYYGDSGDIPVPGDYDGDGAEDIALFRPAPLYGRGSSGMWAIRGLSRIYYGSSGDAVVPKDYDGDGAWEVGIFRPSTGLWAIRGMTRAYYGSTSDNPVPADYDGDLSDEIGIFRSSSGLWGIRNVSRVYFGAAGDIPVTR